MVANDVVRPYRRHLESMGSHRVGIRQVHHTGDFGGGRQEACYWYARFLLDAARAIDRQTDSCSGQLVHTGGYQHHPQSHLSGLFSR